MDELTLVRNVRSGEPGPSAAESEAARQALLAAIDTDDRARPAAADRRRTRRLMAGRLHLWIPGAATAAALVTGVVILTVSPGAAGPARHAGPQPPARQRDSAPVIRPAQLTAAYVLRRAANAAAREPLTDGRYLFTESEAVTTTQVGTGPVNWQGPYLRQSWLGNGVTGQIVQPAVGPAVPIPPGIAAGVGELSWSQVRHLPTSRRSLHAIVARHAAGLFPKYPHSLTFSEFDTISMLLFESPTPPKVAAALYRLAASLPGIQVVDTTDLVGRAAIEVYIEPGPKDPPGNGYALFFDRATDGLLGESTISAAGPQCPASWSIAILAQGYVRSLRQRPPGTPAAVEPAYYAKSVHGCPPV